MISGKYHLGSIGHRWIWHLARTSPTLIAVEIRTSLTFKTDGGVRDEALRPNKGGNHMFVLPLQQEVGCERKQSGDDPQKVDGPLSITKGHEPELHTERSWWSQMGTK